MSLTLIHPGDMTLDEAFATNTSDKSVLMKVVWEYYCKQIESWPKPWHEEDQGLSAEERDALLAMLERHKDWSEGIHNLKLIEPHWSPWYLIVCETRVSYPNDH